jgi:hypothetical protein
VALEDDARHEAGQRRRDARTDSDETGAFVAMLRPRSPLASLVAEVSLSAARTTLQRSFRSENGHVRHSHNRRTHRFKQNAQLLAALSLLTTYAYGHSSNIDPDRCVVMAEGLSVLVNNAPY